MNTLAAWFVMMGLLGLGWSIERAADKIATHQCATAPAQEGGAA
jgi:hypothetical protein